MDRIELRQVLPEAFATCPECQSDIWKQAVTLQKGTSYLIEAASGTGKSSLCSYLYGYRSDYKGDICFDGQDIRSLSTKAWTGIRQHSLSFLFQELRLFGELTAFENVWLKNQLTHYKSEKEVMQLFEAMDIADKWQARTDKLSYGQQQRVAFIRCMCQPFDFILLDEPVSHLDETNAQRMRTILQQEARRQGAGILITSIGKRLPLDYDQVLQL